jgi:BirA family biotin operon repressor/biotin-[acetyl-CoA-carboxylase] ligase
MSAPAIVWPCRNIERSLAPVLPNLRVEVLAEVDSTNTELMRRARGGHMAPVLLVAEQQTAGRGRLGRPWRSAPGASLTFSLGLPLAPPDWSGLSLAVGVAVAESLHPDARLKWPNDLWLGGAPGERKLGGILIETASIGALRYTVIGVGLNVAAPPAVGLAMPAGGLQELLPGADAAQVLERVAAPLAQAVRTFEALGFAPFQARFNARDVLQGREVKLADAQGGIVTGSAHGVTETGALLVHTEAGMQQITSSEVSVRPLHARAGAVAGRP